MATTIQQKFRALQGQRYNIDVLEALSTQPECVDLKPFFETFLTQTKEAYSTCVDQLNSESLTQFRAKYSPNSIPEKYEPAKRKFDEIEISALRNANGFHLPPEQRNLKLATLAENFIAHIVTIGDDDEAFLGEKKRMLRSLINVWLSQNNESDDDLSDVNIVPLANPEDAISDSTEEEESLERQENPLLSTNDIPPPPGGDNLPPLASSAPKNNILVTLAKNKARTFIYGNSPCYIVNASAFDDKTFARRLAALVENRPDAFFAIVADPGTSKTKDEILNATDIIWKDKKNNRFRNKETYPVIFEGETIENRIQKAIEGFGLKQNHKGEINLVGFNEETEILDFKTETKKIVACFPAPLGYVSQDITKLFLVDASELDVEGNFPALINNIQHKHYVVIVAKNKDDVAGVTERANKLFLEHKYPRLFASVTEDDNSHCNVMSLAEVKNILESETQKIPFADFGFIKSDKTQNKEDFYKDKLFIISSARLQKNDTFTTALVNAIRDNAHSKKRYAIIGNHNAQEQDQLKQLFGDTCIIAAGTQEAIAAANITTPCEVVLIDSNKDARDEFARTHQSTGFIQYAAKRPGESLGFTTNITIPKEPANVQITGSINWGKLEKKLSAFTVENNLKYKVLNGNTFVRFVNIENTPRINPIVVKKEEDGSGCSLKTGDASKPATQDMLIKLALEIANATPDAEIVITANETLSKALKLALNQAIKDNKLLISCRVEAAKTEDASRPSLMNAIPA